MNNPVDMFEFTITGFQTLGGADQCRALDNMHEIVGPRAPIPHFVDMEDEAKFWAESVDQETLKIFFKAISRALTPEHRKAGAEFMIKEASKSAP